MLLRCPHCQKRAEHSRGDFLGDWVVCPACELPFAWRRPQGCAGDTSAEKSSLASEEHDKAHSEE
ncbi:MAG: hypothetical protein AMS21_04410 [Gemmatimonas sp. SG8_38_2]|nr:MAG: hypothetical protein AMS21_04410 [Gemmatimonas sp. SG8_38_2]